MPVEFGTQSRDEFANLGVDRADAVEVIVVLGDLKHPLAGNVASAKHVLQKRNDIVPLLGTPETDHQDGVIG